MREARAHTPTPPRPAPRGPGRCRAFTLIELILVLVVLAILVAMAVPTFQQMALSQGGKQTTAQILVLTNYARTQAIADGVSYRLIIDQPNRTYYLAKQDLTDFIPLGTGIGQPHVIPDGVTVAWDNAFLIQQQQEADATGRVEPTKLPSNLPCVEFRPSGRVDPAVIVVTDRDGSTHQIVCPSATETFRVVGPDGVLRY